jgi:hypothetical protein
MASPPSDSPKTVCARTAKRLFENAARVNTRAKRMEQTALALGRAGKREQAIQAIKFKKEAEALRDSACEKGFAIKGFCAKKGVNIRHGVDYDASPCLSYVSRRLSSKARGQSVSPPSRSPKTSSRRGSGRRRALRDTSYSPRRMHMHRHGGVPSAADFRAAAASGQTVTVISHDKVYKIRSRRHSSHSNKRYPRTAFNAIERMLMRDQISYADWRRRMRDEGFVISVRRTRL